MNRIIRTISKINSISNLLSRLQSIKTYYKFFVLNYIFYFLLALQYFPRNSQNFDYFLENIVRMSNNNFTIQEHLYSTCFVPKTLCKINEPLYLLGQTDTLFDPNRDGVIFYKFLSYFLTNQLFTTILLLYALVGMASVLIQTIVFYILSKKFKNIYIISLPIFNLFISIMQTTFSIAPIGLSFWLSLGIILIQLGESLNKVHKKIIIFIFFTLLFLLRFDQFMITLVVFFVLTKVRRQNLRALTFFTVGIAGSIIFFIFNLQIFQQKKIFIINLWSDLGNVRFANFNIEFFKQYYYFLGDIYPPESFQISTDLFYKSSNYIVLLCIFTLPFILIFSRLAKVLNLSIFLRIVYLFVIIFALQIINSMQIRLELRYVQSIIISVIILIITELTNRNLMPKAGIIYLLSALHFTIYILISAKNSNNSLNLLGNYQYFLYILLLFSYFYLLKFLFNTLSKIATYENSRYLKTIKP